MKDSNNEFKSSTWRTIEERVMRALSGIVYNIWGNVGFGTAYKADKNEIELVVWDRSCKCNDKKLVVDKIFNYEINKPEYITASEIVSLMEKYLIENYC